MVGGLGSAGGAAAAPVAKAASNAPIHNCTFKTYNKGRYLTAVGGGGRTSDVLHTDADSASAPGRSSSSSTRATATRAVATRLPDEDQRTTFTAVGGGGRITDVMHFDAAPATGLGEAHRNALGNGVFAIQTIDGHYPTRRRHGGGRITDTIHSDATRVGSWEKFQVACNQ